MKIFHQRTLSASSSQTAQLTCYAAAIVIAILGIPHDLIGAVAASTDATFTLKANTLYFLLAAYISKFQGLRSASRELASDCEMQWVIRISVVVVGLAGTGLTFLDSSVLVFWIVGVDMSYTIMFPQLVCILFFKVSNGYGAIVGYIMGLLMRILSGEPLIGLPPAIQFPGCRLDKEGKLTQYFPFRTAIMLISLMSILLVSLLASIIFNKGLLPEKWDVFNVKRRQRATAKVTRIKRTNSEKEEAAVFQPKHATLSHNFTSYFCQRISVSEL
uniref:High affinity choline transporter 1-like n=1 Tax=Neolamprologus brichardi TaxID=32507 RepID=A0A3Q4N2G8_NEOBR